MLMHFPLKVNSLFLGANPFIEAYGLSDWLGKGIFIALYLLSIVSWIILICKLRQIYIAKKKATLFRHELFQKPAHLLKLAPADSSQENNPFFAIYTALRKHTINLLNKNRLHSPEGGSAGENAGNCYLSTADLDFIQAHLVTTGTAQIHLLDRNLFILSTTVSLAPFLGLLGTVWGILVTFSALQHSGAAAASNQMVLGGLSLALATTVLGLLDAIPALIGYNYLKNEIRSFETEQESFSTELLATLEIYYRKVE